MTWQIRFGPNGRWVALSVLLSVTLWTIGSSCSTGCGRHVDERLNDVESMVSDSQLIGLTREALIAKLGDGTTDKTFSGWDFVYYLGSDGSCIDSRWLLVRLDQGGRVTAAKVTND